MHGKHLEAVLGKLAFALFSTSRKGELSLWMACEWLGYYDMGKHGDKRLLPNVPDQ